MIEREEMPKDKFNDFCDRLEKEIINKDNKDHYEKIVELFRNPQNWGKMSDDETSAFHSERGKNGELLEFYLKINPEERVEKASFFTDGCGCMVAVASQTTLLIQGKRLDVVEKLSVEDIDNALHRLPNDEKHCAELAISVLQYLIKAYKK